MYPVNTYEITLSLSSDYYQLAANASVFTVYDPSLGFTTGGGWFYWPETDEKTNFGYVMQYGKNGRNLKGSLLVIRHTDSGIYRVKSNALAKKSLAVGEYESPSFGWASFSGKCTYKEPGWVDPIGNIQFIVYVEDYGEPGKNIDKFWITVDYPAAGMSMNKPGFGNAIEIGGGNIVVPHITGREKK